MNQQPIDPYAPPKADVFTTAKEEVNHTESFDDDVYRHGKYLVMKMGAQLPPYCVRSGIEVNESNGKRQEVTIYRNLTFMERKWWVNLLMPVAIFMTISGLFLSFMDAFSNSFWILFVGGAFMLRFLARISVQRYSVTISFSNDYLRFEKVFKSLLYIVGAVASVVSLLYLVRDESALAQWVLVCIVFIASLFRGGSLLIKKHDGDYLYILWAEDSFLEKLPQKPF